MESQFKNTSIKVASKILGGIHFTAQTVADLALNAEVQLKQTQGISPKAVIDHRVTKTLEIQAKLGIVNPYDSIKDMQITD